jgi:hypothetical protein
MFEDTDILTRTSKDRGYVYRRDCKLKFPVNDILQLEPKDSDFKLIQSQIKKALEIQEPRLLAGLVSREYNDLLGSMNDSHIEVEKLGICESQGPFTVVLSLEDSLDYILHLLTGTSTEKIRTLPDYRELSRAIMKINPEALGELTFNLFSQVDPALSSYLQDLVRESEDTESFVERFFTKIFTQADRILEYICGYLYINLQATGRKVVIRSKSIYCYVFSTASEINEELTLKIPGKEDYKLLLKSYKAREYIDRYSEQFTP